MAVRVGISAHRLGLLGDLGLDDPGEFEAGCAADPEAQPDLLLGDPLMPAGQLVAGLAGFG
jgi:hypothetical protein